MSGLGIITFISDSGWGGGYVAVCEAVVTRIRPAVRVLHISHEVPAGDIAAGALVLERIAPLYPPAVHLAIVDPGVGTARRPLALETERGDVLVGPDNGLLIGAAMALGGIRATWVLDPAKVRVQAGLPVDQISATFHGRDVFAPTTALLATAVDPASVASSADPAGLTRLAPPQCEITAQGAVAQVIEVDRFGNVGLALRFTDLSPREGRYLVGIVDEDLPDWKARVVRTYGELQPGELGVFCDSWGQVALALKSASAAELLAVGRGMRVRLSPIREPFPAGS
ncbi:MAG: SAM-dependent chlorinase/fluorinase [Thermoleophilia bacterium]|nr:SAM-dependent chlorinase/fluorinase [Thermoleophilia bacterium]